MNARHFVISLALSLLGTGLWAQQDSLPQVFSPNAAELGKYGKIPVSYFNGLPNISIPLTELKAKNYTLPIYLSYHASGNKPDQHPGWVGLGWTLHAGGCINRIVNGMKDEMTINEYADTYSYQASSHPGYYFHPSAVQQPDWTNLQVRSDSLGNSRIFDREPDEFQVCLDDIQASFYFTGDGAIRIVSKSAADFTIAVHLANGENHPVVVYPGPETDDDTGRAKRFFYFDEITLTSSDGTKYVFGGNDNAIEYSMQLQPVFTGPEYNPQNIGQWKCRATANTWLLSRIERPDGEAVLFSYTKDGTPIVRQDLHHMEFCSYGFDSPFQHYEDTKEYPNQSRNISFCLIQPSYLQRISCHSSPDSLVFSRTRSSELKYATTSQEFEFRAGNYLDWATSAYSTAQIMAEDYYMQLSQISGPGRNIQMTFSSDSTRRLTLQHVSFFNGESTTDHRYTFDYNSERLPVYHARQSDLWGYYNGINYNGTAYNRLELVRGQVNPVKAQAEILTTIYYPTGGRTEFEYEGHNYSKEVAQVNVALENKNANYTAGGLRIREIRDYPETGPVEKRTFNYTEASGLSSGILAGSPRLYVHGHCSRIVYLGEKPEIWELDGAYTLASEHPVRPLSTTDGNHVTYSQVKETKSDGSFSVYRYSNHDQPQYCDRNPLWRSENLDSLLLFNAFDSKELFRGLLLRKTDFNADNRMIQDVSNEYNLDTTARVKAINIEMTCDGLLSCYSYKTVFAAFPYLKKKTVKLYPDSGNTSSNVYAEYSYDSHRRLVEVKRKVKGVMQRDKYKYIDDCNGEPYYSMKSRNMIAYPVEHLHYRKDTTKAEKVVGAELTTWKASENNRFVPKEKFVAALGEGVSSFTPFNGSTKDSHYGEADILYERYDTVGNVLLAKDRTGIPTTFFWDSRGVNPTFIAKDAMNGAQTRSVPGTVTKTEEDDYTSVRVIEKPFTSVETGSFSLSFTPEGPVTDVVVTLDGDTLTVQELIGPDETVIAYTYMTQGGSSNYLPAGNHEVCITCVPAPIPVRSLPNSNATLASPSPAARFSGTLSIAYAARGLVVRTLTANDLFFEDFESATSGPAGFHSGKGRTGSYTVSIQNLDPYRNHVLDYRRKTGSGAWEYVRTSFTGSATIGGPGVTVDQIRVFPEDADVESYTWDSAGNLLSRTDARGITESYEYDALGRLIAIRNNGENYVEQYEYNYQNK